MYKRRRCPPNSFTLIELLVVMAIMIVLASLSIPAISSLMRSSNLTVGSNSLTSQFNLSRQYAMTKNCQVEIRLYELPDASAPSSTSPSVYRAFQSFSLDNSGAQTNALTKAIYLPNQIYMVANSTASSLLVSQSPPYSVLGTAVGAPLGPYPPASYNYLAFHFKPDGSTDLNPNSAQLWYVSLANQHDKIQDATSGLPANFITVQIDALTGRVRYFRPN
jgi:uncharacterized protein (TIGR02596 family)